MKCIRCNHDSKKIERVGGNCPNCKQAFAFEPTIGDTFTDQKFATALDRVSSGGTVRFTVNHLYFELARSTRSSAGLFTPGQGRTEQQVFAAIAIVFALDVGLAVALAMASVALVIPFLLHTIYLLYKLASVQSSRSTKINLGDANAMLAKWTRAHGSPKGLVVRRDAPQTRTLPPDLGHYSFDRAVITDTSETVAMLVANNFHFENNCAILAANGYPEGIFKTVLAMLRNNPRLRVYVLHDVSVRGLTLANELRQSPHWFHGTGATVIDVGLHGSHVEAFRGCWEPAHGALDLSQVPAEWHSWLLQFTLPLAVVRPEQTIKRLFRAMTQEQDPALVESGDVMLLPMDTTSFSSDATTSDGGGDSFG